MFVIFQPLTMAMCLIVYAPPTTAGSHAVCFTSHSILALCHSLCTSTSTVPPCGGRSSGSITVCSHTALEVVADITVAAAVAVMGCHNVVLAAVMHYGTSNSNHSIYQTGFVAEF